MLNKRGSRIDPWRTPNFSSNHSLKDNPTFVLRLRSDIVYKLQGFIRESICIQLYNEEIVF